MNSRPPFTVPWLLVVLFLAGVGPLDAQPTSRAYVLDAGAPAIVSVELPSARRLSSVPLSGNPQLLIQSPEGSRLVALDRGPGDDKRERGYKATGKSVATIVDAASLAVVGRVELGWGLDGDRFYWSADGSRLTLLCPGYEAKNPGESLARELVVVDVRTARELGRLALEPGAVPIVASKDGRWLPLIQGLPRTDKFPYPQSRLWIADLETPSVLAKLDMGGWTNLYTDGAFFYLLDPGKPDKNLQKNRNGSVEIASVAQHALLGRFDAGRAPRGLYQDEVGGQVFVPSDGPPEGREGELRVFRGSALAATLKVAANPKLLERKGDVVYVVGEREVTLVDPVALQVSATIPLAKGSEALVDDGDWPTELKTSPDGKRAFVLYGGKNRVAVLDVEQRRAVGATKTGRGGKKLLGNMMMALGGALGAAAVGYPVSWYAPPTMLAVRPDGRYGYALNMQTKDVTVVDSVTSEAVEKIGGGGYDLRLLTGGKTIAVVSGSELGLLDVATNKKTLELELPDLNTFEVTGDGAYAVVLGERALVCLDGVTGAVKGRLADLTRALAVVLGSSDPPPAAPASP